MKKDIEKQPQLKKIKDILEISLYSIKSNRQHFRKYKFTKKQTVPKKQLFREEARFTNTRRDSRDQLTLKKTLYSSRKPTHSRKH